MISKKVSPPPPIRALPESSSQPTLEVNDHRGHYWMSNKGRKEAFQETQRLTGASELIINAATQNNAFERVLRAAAYTSMIPEQTDDNVLGAWQSAVREMQGRVSRQVRGDEWSSTNGAHFSKRNMRRPQCEDTRYRENLVATTPVSGRATGGRIAHSAYLDATRQHRAVHR